MDVNPSRLESSQHLIILGDDFAQSFKTKSFRCSFCKRGFSNAQALGGHMNIHRKDRAKLREFSDENLLSLDISGGVDSNDNNLPHDSFENDESHDQAEDLNDYSKVIPLFKEAPVQANDVVKGTKVELKYVGLDLELRLGPEPHHRAKSKP